MPKGPESHRRRASIHAVRGQSGRITGGSGSCSTCGPRFGMPRSPSAAAPRWCTGPVELLQVLMVLLVASMCFATLQMLRKRAVPWKALVGSPDRNPRRRSRGHPGCRAGPHSTGRLLDIHAERPLVGSHLHHQSDARRRLTLRSASRTPAASRPVRVFGAAGFRWRSCSEAMRREPDPRSVEQRRVDRGDTGQARPGASALTGRTEPGRARAHHRRRPRTRVNGHIRPRPIVDDNVVR